MKLLLTSAGWEYNGAIGKEFLRLVGKKPSEIKVFFVISPLKYPSREKYISRLFNKFKAIKVPEKNITYFQLDRKVSNKELEGFDVVFVFGGNTFDYLDRMRKTGLDKLIKSYVKKGGVYVGLSAGSYLACPTIEAATWKPGDRNFVKLVNLKGLNFVSFLVTAHFGRKYLSIIREASKNTKYPVIALTDKQAVVVEDADWKIVGSGRKNIFQ
ncbi:MAG TPA: Type 1 glutamine amidotransferase-like domain-containing protein [Candidatus Magasanikbacteria bacterium]|nr:Type 1 glutamine amidotransferase-like domain-containing protein [Candidatus Magasanikbacteria bacterium]